jgi:hypothetical protein
MGIEISAGWRILMWIRPVEQAERAKKMKSERKYETGFGLIGSGNGNHLQLQMIPGLIQ